MDIPRSPLLRSSPSPPSASSTPTTRDAVELPPDFVPSEHDVLCGRSKQSLNHVGNQKFRETIFSHLDEYESALTKLDKSVVVTGIVELLRSKCNNGVGGFVRYDASLKKWMEIGDSLAREKVGHALRDAIKTRNKRKERKRAETKSSMQLKREALLREQRRLFQESLEAAGESMGDASASLLSTTAEEEDEDEVVVVANDKQTKQPVPIMTGTFYKETFGTVLEPPVVARQVTTDHVDDDGLISPMESRKVCHINNNKRRPKAMGDGAYYDIAPTTTTTTCRRQVTLDKDSLVPQQEEQDLFVHGPSTLLPLECMPEPTPVVGPGIMNPKSRILVPPLKRKKEHNQKSITFCLYNNKDEDGVEDDDSSNVVQRIPAWKKHVVEL